MSFHKNLSLTAMCLALRFTEKYSSSVLLVVIAFTPLAHELEPRATVIVISLIQAEPEGSPLELKNEENVMD